MITLALNYKADPNKLLETAVDQRVFSDDGKPYFVIPISNQTRLIQLALEYGAKFTKIQCKKDMLMPSREATEYMLANKIDPLDPIDFNNQVLLNVSCQEFDYEKKIWRDSEKLEKQKESLIILALDRISDNEFQNMELAEFTTIPSIRYSEYLIVKRKVDPISFLRGLLEVSCREFNPEKQVWCISNNLIKRTEKALLFVLSKIDNLQDLTIHYFPYLPSLEISELMLKKGLDPTKFLQAILYTYYSCYNDKKQVCEFNDELIKLIDLSLKRQANFHDIDDLFMLPSLELGNILMKMGFDPTWFLTLVYSYQVDKGAVNVLALKQKLVELALAYKADPKQIKYPAVAEVYNRNEAFIDRSQTHLGNQLIRILEKYKCDDELVKKVQNLTKDGSCFALSTLWLYAKWLQVNYPDKKEYNHAWFQQITKALAVWDDQINLTSNEIANFKKFAETIVLLSSQKKVSHLDISLSKLDTGNKILKEKYGMASELKFNIINELSVLLENTIYDGELLYIGIQVPTKNWGHRIGLFKHGKVFYCYDSNDTKGEYQATSVQEIVKKIFYKYKISNNPLYLQVIVIGEQGAKSHVYPKQRPYFEKVNIKKFSYASLIYSLLGTIKAGDIEAFEYILDSSRFTLTAGDDAISFLDYIINDGIVNRALMIETLLSRCMAVAATTSTTSATIDQSKLLEEPLDDDGKTALQAAIIQGDIAIIKILLSDKRTNVNQVNKVDGKTALMYAKEKGNKAVIDLLVANGVIETK